MKPIVYAKRLLKLANILDALKPEKFDYSTWASAGDGAHSPNVRPPTCGTTACALGHAVSHQDFKACARRHGRTVGLGLRWNDTYEKWDYSVVVDGKDRCVAPVDGYDCFWGDVAASKILFDLDAGEHEELFVPSSEEDNATPKYVAKKIRKFVANKYGKEVLNG
jgi:hypothetical protein